MTKLLCYQSNITWESEDGKWSVSKLIVWLHTALKVLDTRELHRPDYIYHLALKRGSVSRFLLLQFSLQLKVLDTRTSVNCTDVTVYLPSSSIHVSKAMYTAAEVLEVNMNASD